jgi:predicted kinase
MNLAVVVSGAPGAGKTTVAVPLAAALGLPLLSKDVIKEQLYDSLPTPPPGENPLLWSRKIGGAGMDLLWTLAAYSPRVVLEAPFRPHSEYERARLAGLHRPLIEVHCACPADIAAQRYADRSKTPERHRGAHPMTELPAEFFAQFDWPLGLDQVVTVNTSAFVDHSGVARKVVEAMTAIAG